MPASQRTLKDEDPQMSGYLEYTRNRGAATQATPGSLRSTFILGDSSLEILDNLRVLWRSWTRAYFGCNFLIGVLLGRWLLPEQYGAYALAFAVFLLLSYLHQALLCEPPESFRFL